MNAQSKITIHRGADCWYVHRDGVGIGVVRKRRSPATGTYWAVVGNKQAGFFSTREAATNWLAENVKPEPEPVPFHRTVKVSALVRNVNVLVDSDGNEIPRRESDEERAEFQALLERNAAPALTPYQEARVAAFIDEGRPEAEKVWVLGFSACPVLFWTGAEIENYVEDEKQAVKLTRAAAEEIKPLLEAAQATRPGSVAFSPCCRIWAAPEVK